MALSGFIAAEIRANASLAPDVGTMRSAGTCSCSDNAATNSRHCGSGYASKLAAATLSARMTCTGMPNGLRLAEKSTTSLMPYVSPPCWKRPIV